MISIIQKYFSTVPDSHRIILVTICLIFFWNIENLIAAGLGYKKWKHAFVNGLFVFTDVPVQIFFGILFSITVHAVDVHQIGILNHLPYNHHFWFQLLSTFILLDFFEYIYHVFMHKTKILWMFHIVHHSDPIVDVSTTLREHPGESFIRLSFLLLWVLISGAVFWAILFRQFIQIVSNILAHSNFRFNAKVDKIIGLVFITPNLHQVHHHHQQPYTDSNYGDVLSIWDHLFGTFKRIKVNPEEFGIDSCSDINENSNFIKLIRMPFGGYRPPTKKPFL